MLESRAIPPLVFVLAVLAGSGPRVEAGDCSEDFIVTVGLDDQLRLLEPSNGETILALPIQPPPGQAVLAGHALASDPQSGQLYGILQLVPHGFALMRLDPHTGASEFVGAPRIGNTVLNLQGITFGKMGELFGITDDLSAFPSSLVALDRDTAEATFLCSLGNGDRGEAIAFHAPDQMLYHASGDLEVVFEVIEDPGPSTCGVSPIPISGTQLDDGPVQELTPWPGESVFLWKQGGTGGPLFRVTPSGNGEELGVLDHDARGLAVVEIPTPCPPTFFIRGDSDLDLVLALDDALLTLNALFVPGSKPLRCGDAADCNDDGELSLADPILALNFLFVPGSDPIPAPFPDCEHDPTPDELFCEAPPCP